MRARAEEVVSVEEKRSVQATLERWERARISPAPLSRVGRSRLRRAQPGSTGGITHYSGFIVAAGQPCGGATTNARLERCATSCFRTFVTAPGRVVPRSQRAHAPRAFAGSVRKRARWLNCSSAFGHKKISFVVREEAGAFISSTVASYYFLIGRLTVNPESRPGGCSM